MPSPHAHRHLRHVTGGAEAQTYQEALAAAATGDAAAAAVATAAAEGRDLPPEAGLPVAAVAAYAGGPSGGRLRVRVEAAGIIAGVVPSLGEVSRAMMRFTAPCCSAGWRGVRVACGGTASLRLSTTQAAAPIHLPTHFSSACPPTSLQAVEPGVPVPALDIRVGGEGLHGPLVERLIELPMDIASGQVGAEGMMEWLGWLARRIWCHDPQSPALSTAHPSPPQPPQPPIMRSSRP